MRSTQPSRLLVVLALALFECRAVQSLITVISQPFFGVNRAANTRFVTRSSGTSQPIHDRRTDKFDETSSSSKNIAKGDPIRASSGVRPSLHPITINILTQVLKKRYLDEKDALTLMDEDALSSNNSTLQYALDAAAIASSALALRTTHDDDKKLAFSLEEQQTIAGRVVNISVRLVQLEHDLYAQCQKYAPRLDKYNEWELFGVVKEEPNNGSTRKQLETNPLFALSRAECLLAMYLQNIEAPELLRKNVTVPGGSVIDFIDQDRVELLFDL
ncbi:hypothetical protein MPSEU_000633100 [Mayamaea pseudoterrestris]|nr:hypothetical protein MPSEU_000633100 [Mayamaea pseudoterrestris]